MLKLEFVPAAGDKIMLNLSPPPPLADKQASLTDNTTVIDSRGGNAVGIPSEPVSLKDGIDTGTGGTGTASTGTGNVPSEREPSPLKDGIDAGGGDVAGELSPMKSLAKVGIVPADDGRMITLVISASPLLLGAKVNVKDISVAKTGTEDVPKKDPAAEKAPDAGAVDSDKAKAMFAAHAPRPSAVFWSKFERPTGPPTAPTGAVEGALKKDIPAAESGAEASVDETGAIKNPALKPATEVATALKPAADCGETLPSIKDFPEPAPAGDDGWTVSAKEFPKEKPAPAGEPDWIASNSRNKTERKGEVKSTKVSNKYDLLDDVETNVKAEIDEDEDEQEKGADKGADKQTSCESASPESVSPEPSSTPFGFGFRSGSGFICSGFGFGNFRSSKLLCIVFTSIVVLGLSCSAFASKSGGVSELLHCVVVPDATAVPVPVVDFYNTTPATEPDAIDLPSVASGHDTEFSAATGRSTTERGPLFAPIYPDDPDDFTINPEVKHTVTKQSFLKRQRNGLGSAAISLGTTQFWGGYRFTVNVGLSEDHTVAMLLDTGSSSLAFCPGTVSPSDDHAIKTAYHNCNKYGTAQQHSGYSSVVYQGDMYFAGQQAPLDNVYFNIMEDSVTGMPCESMGAPGVHGIFGVAFKVLDPVYQWDVQYPNCPTEQPKDTVYKVPALVDHLTTNDSPQFGVHWEGQVGPDTATLYLGAQATSNPAYDASKVLKAIIPQVPTERSWYNIDIVQVQVNDEMWDIELLGQFNANDIPLGELDNPKGALGYEYDFFLPIMDTGTVDISLPGPVYEAVQWAGSGTLTFVIKGSDSHYINLAMDIETLLSKGSWVGPQHGCNGMSCKGPPITLGFPLSYFYYFVYNVDTNMAEFVPTNGNPGAANPTAAPQRKYICDVKTVEYPYGPAGEYNNADACAHLNTFFPYGQPYTPITAALGSNGDFNQGDGGNSYFVFMCVQHSVQGKCFPNGAGQDRSPVTNVMQFGAMEPKSACDGHPAAEIVKNQAGVPQDFNKGAGGSYIYACFFRSAPSEETPGLWDIAIALATDTCNILRYSDHGKILTYASADFYGVGVNGNWNQGASGGLSKALCLSNPHIHIVGAFK